MSAMIVCLSETPERDLRGVLGRMVEAAGVEKIEIAGDFGERVPVLVVVAASDCEAGMGILERLGFQRGAARMILVADELPEGVGERVFDTAVRRGDEEGLAGAVRDQLTRYVIAHDPVLLSELAGLLDLGMISGALVSARESLVQMTGRYQNLGDSVMGMPEGRIEEGKDELMREVERFWGNPKRLRLEAGEVLIREGDASQGIWIIEKGEIELFRVIDGEELVFHTEPAGRVIGLMSWYRQSPIFFSGRAREASVVVPLDRDEVRRGLRGSPEFAGHLIGTILRSMARRNRRAAQLLIKNQTLTHLLGERKVELERSLESLRAAQDQLVESEKMRTLGILSAGMAHELNNPVAVISRASEQLREDLSELLSGELEHSLVAKGMELAISADPISTREERKIRKVVEGLVSGDRALAGELVANGITGENVLKEILEGSKVGREEAMGAVRLGGVMGRGLRNLASSARRISKLVGSLKLYVREENDWDDGVEVNRTLDDVVGLLGGHLKMVEVEKDYGELPVIRARRSQLEQVWTNLMINAIQAMEGGGFLRIGTRYLAESGMVEVEIEDHGPGIPEAVQAKLFEHRFTTRAKQVEFGLGLGLPISKALVGNHGGEIHFESKPGRTVFRVRLPKDPPR